MHLQIIEKKFSRAASNYDRHADIQKYFADLLLERLKSDRAASQNMLDIGTGTGNLLQGLSYIYPSANIAGLDISWGMLSKARERMRRLLQADAAQLPFKDNSFDLVISNLALQWVVHLQSCFSEIARILKKEGNLYFNIFGPQTLKELKVIFPAIEERFILSGLPDIERLLEKTGFKNIQSQRLIEKRIYPTMTDIVKWLKNIGANYTGYIPVKSLGMRKIWQEAESNYKNQFAGGEGVYATFETFLIKAKRA
ncbi:MAG: methyltransferase domain-containing protein [Candidatus Omnitrophica bacterium]|nr:methyltransferase domain-containing protein [Candidatus Omnitrophota bacterium]